MASKPIKIEPSMLLALLQGLSIEQTGAYLRCLLHVSVFGSQTLEELRLSVPAEVLESIRHLLEQQDDGSFLVKTGKKEPKKGSPEPSRSTEPIRVPEQLVGAFPVSVPYWWTPEVAAVWREFLAYRLSQWKIRYKSESTAQHAVDVLGRFYTSADQCIDGLRLAMARSWRFPVDPQSLYNGDSTKNRPQQKAGWLRAAR